MSLLPFLTPALAYLTGIFVGVALLEGYYRKHDRIRPKGRCGCARTLDHPNAGRFCHICGADAAKNEHCDVGLHS